MNKIVNMNKFFSSSVFKVLLLNSTILFFLGLQSLNAQVVNTIADTGRVGIGITNPQCNLEVKGESRFIGNLRVDSSLVVNDSVRTNDLRVSGSLAVSGDIITNGSIGLGGGVRTHWNHFFWTIKWNLFRPSTSNQFSHF